MSQLLFVIMNCWSFEYETYLYFFRYWSRNRNSKREQCLTKISKFFYELLTFGIISKKKLCIFIIN